MGFRCAEPETTGYTEQVRTLGGDYGTIAPVGVEILVCFDFDMAASRVDRPMHVRASTRADGGLWPPT